MSEFDDLYGEWATSTVGVETYRGKGALGDNFDTLETVSGIMVNEGTRFVRNQNGDQEVSDTTLYMNEASGPKFTPGSKVHLATRDTIVIHSAMLAVFGLIDHAVVNLQ